MPEPLWPKAQNDPERRAIRADLLTLSGRARAAGMVQIALVIDLAIAVGADGERPTLRLVPQDEAD